MTSTQGDGWIKMTERKPEQADCPVWFATTIPGDCILKHWATVAYRDFETFTHWQPAVLPAPPKPKEQWMQDLEARDEAWTTAEKVCRANGGGWFSEGWNMALAYRDGQNREDLEAVIGMACAGMNDGRAIMNSLRRRCGLSQ